MTGTPASRHRRAATSRLREIAYRAGWWLALVAAIDIGAGAVMGAVMWWLGWRHPPIKDFFVALAGIGGALLIAYSVTVTQALPAYVRNATRGETGDVAASVGRVFGLALGVAQGAVVGIGACLALVRDPSRQAHFWLMTLSGIGLFCLGVLAVAIGLGTMVYVYLVFEE